MIRWNMIAGLALVCVFTFGCRKPVNDQDAIRASIEKRLNARSDLNLAVMDREIKQVTVNGDHAAAQVEFRLKGGDARMEIEYALERQGKDWTVLSGHPMGMDNPHSGADQPSSPANGGGQLPAGHPPTN